MTNKNRKKQSPTKLIYYNTNCKLAIFLFLFIANGCSNEQKYIDFQVELRPKIIRFIPIEKKHKFGCPYVRWPENNECITSSDHLLACDPGPASCLNKIEIESGNQEIVSIKPYFSLGFLIHPFNDGELDSTKKTTIRLLGCNTKNEIVLPPFDDTPVEVKKVEHTKDKVFATVDRLEGDEDNVGFLGGLGCMNGGISCYYKDSSVVALDRLGCGLSVADVATIILEPVRRIETYQQPLGEIRVRMLGNKNLLHVFFPQPGEDGCDEVPIGEFELIDFYIEDHPVYGEIETMGLCVDTEDDDARLWLDVKVADAVDGNQIGTLVVGSRNLGKRVRLDINGAGFSGAFRGNIGDPEIVDPPEYGMGEKDAVVVRFGPMILNEAEDQGEAVEVEFTLSATTREWVSAPIEGE
jgi:hypothetical protein